MKKSPLPIVMYTVDIRPVPQVSPDHKVIIKDANDLSCDDLDNCKQPLGMIFFDCHNYNAQMNLYHKLWKYEFINNSTIVLLHDTGVWPTSKAAQCVHGKRAQGVKGYIHQVPERKMVNTFISYGYHCVNLFPPDVKIFTKEYNLPFRHGVSICQKNTKLIL